MSMGGAEGGGLLTGPERERRGRENIGISWD